MQHAEHQPIWKRLVWFVGLWLAGVCAVALVAAVIKFWIGT